MPKHTIRTLSDIPVHPTDWRIEKNIANHYILYYRYDTDGIKAVHTERGQIKVYKTIQSLFRDLEKVTTEAVIFYSGR